MEDSKLEVRDLIAEYIAETIKASSRLGSVDREQLQLQKRLLVLEGNQESLGRLFLNGDEVTLQEAFDTNLHGLKDAVEKLK